MLIWEFLREGVRRAGSATSFVPLDKNQIHILQKLLKYIIISEKRRFTFSLLFLTLLRSPMPSLPHSHLMITCSHLQLLADLCQSV